LTTAPNAEGVGHCGRVGIWNRKTRNEARRRDGFAAAVYKLVENMVPVRRRPL